MNPPLSNEPTPNPTPNVDPFQPTPPEHERRDGRRGFHGLGHTTKTPFRSGVNSSLPDALHGDVDTHATLTRETPAHRKMVELAIQGFTIKETVSLMGVSRPTVKNVLRQPWAREYMITSMKQSTVDEVTAMLKDELLPSLEVLISVRDSVDTRPETKAAVANQLIDRVLGRAAQPILTGKIDVKQLSDEELAAMLPNRGTTPSN